MKKILPLLSIGLLLIAACNKNKNPMPPLQVSTFAGSGAAGFANGTGTAASFNFPAGIVTDKAGNIYVADAQNNVIRKITPAGLVTTFAGSGQRGAVDGTGIAASLNQPSAVAIDASGYIYVADEGNNEVRKISSAGVVTTIAGHGIKGFADGQGTAASFYGPNAIAVDAAGNIFIADIYKVRKIDATGMVSTIAGSGAAGFANGVGAAASFSVLTGIAVDASGTIYVSDNGNNGLIRKVTQAGIVSTFAGTGGQAGVLNGTISSVPFSGASGLAWDAAGNLYVSDAANNVVRKIDMSTSMASTVAGSMSLGSANGNYLSATFYQPQDVTIDASGNLYVADSKNNLIRKVAAGY